MSTPADGPGGDSTPVPAESTDETAAQDHAVQEPVERAAAKVGPSQPAPVVAPRSQTAGSSSVALSSSVPPSSPPPSIPIGAAAARTRAETHPDTAEIEVVPPLSVVRVVPNVAYEAPSVTRATPPVGAGSTPVTSLSPSPSPSLPAPSTPLSPGGSAPQPATDGSSEAPGAARTETTPVRRLRSAFRPRMTRAQLLAAVLCAVLGFALVVQLQQNQQDEFSGLRQSDLVRILDDVSKRSDALEREATSLRETEFELRSGSDSQQAAIELAEKNAEIQGILSGRLPAEGPGLEIQIVQGSTAISAARLFNVLEELRNAGAEAIDVNGIRMVTSSYFEDTSSGVSINGIVVAPPYRWTVIGDPQTLEPAMAIPGGAMASITTSGGRTTIEQKDLVQIRSVRDPAEPRFAKPATD